MKNDSRKTLNGKSIGWWLLSSIGVVLAIFLGRGAYLGYLNYNGYCFEQHRYLSDQEKYRLVVDRMMERATPPPFWPMQDRKGNVVKDKRGEIVWVVSKDGNTTPSDDPVYPIHFKNADEFFALNPNCCEMVPVAMTSEGQIDPPTFFDRVLGDFSGGVVRVTAHYRFRDKSGVLREVAHTYDVSLRNCGKEFNPL